MAANINHVAVIMDGNGRWAKDKSHSRFWGHIKGSSLVSDIVEEADNLGLKALTLYAFSTENISRPIKEINVLFKLLKKYILKERNRIIKNQIKFKVIGEYDFLPDEQKKLIADLESDTKNAKGLKLNFAFGYGGRQEIVHAVNQFFKKNPDKKLTLEDLDHFLYDPESGDVDLVIRTGGDKRISNFLLWQIAYAELFFTKTLWPDFSVEQFRSIIESVQKRERRFGNISEVKNWQQTKESSSMNKTFFENSQN